MLVAEMQAQSEFQIPESLAAIAYVVVDMDGRLASDDMSAGFPLRPCYTFRPPACHCDCTALLVSLAYVDCTIRPPARRCIHTKFFLFLILSVIGQSVFIRAPRNSFSKDRICKRINCRQKNDAKWRNLEKFFRSLLQSYKHLHKLG